MGENWKRINKFNYMKNIQKIFENVLIFVILPLSYFDRLNVPFVNSTHGLLKLCCVAMFFIYIFLSWKKYFNLKLNSSILSIFLLYLLSILISDIFSLNKGPSMKMFIYYFISILLFIFFKTVVNKLNINKIIRVLFVLTITSVIIKFAWLLIPNLYLFVIEKFVLGSSFSFITYIQSTGRLHIWDASVYSLYLLLYLSFYGKKFRKLASFGWLALLFFIVLSASRTYFIVTILGIIIFFGFNIRFFGFKFSKKMIVAFLMFVVVCFLSIQVSTLLNMKSVVSRVKLTFTNDPTLSGRLDQGAECLWQFRNYPWFGTGQNTFSFSAPKNSELWDYNYKEYLVNNNFPEEYGQPSGNNILVYLSETGIVGFFILLCLWSFVFVSDVRYMFRKEISNEKKIRYLAFAIPSGLLFPLVNVTDTPGSFEIMYFYIFRGMLLSDYWFTKDKK